MEDNKKVKLVFEFDREDYDRFCILSDLGKRCDVEKIWKDLSDSEINLIPIDFSSLGVDVEYIKAAFILHAIFYAMRNNLQKQQHE